MKQYSEYRKSALNALEGNWAKLCGIYVLYLVITMCVVEGSSLPLSPLGMGWELLGNLCYLFLLPMTMSIYTMCLKTYRKTNVEVFQELFGYYSTRVWTTIFLKQVYLVLWSLLLVIPGIIKSYSYSLTEFILLDEPDLSNNAAIERSMAMMNGHKKQMFFLDLTFIGWAILALLTFGLGFILLTPYAVTARAALYEDIKAEWQASHTTAEV